MNTVLRWLGRAGAVAGLPLLLAAATGCSRLSNAAPAPSPETEAAPAAVATVRPERQTLRRAVEQPAQIEGFEQTALVAKISGYVQKINADIGDRVTKGQVLAELWVPELVEELHQKEAAEAQAKAEIEQARRMLKVAEAAVARAGANVRLAVAGRTRADASLARWRSELERVRRMLRSGASDEQTLDQTMDQYKSAEAARGESAATIQSAEAAHGESLAQRDKAEADVAVAETKLRVAAADRARTAANLGYAEVRAPFDGVVTKKLVDTGAYLQATATGANAALFVVVRTDPVRIFLDVPEAAAAGVQKDMLVRIRLSALDDLEVEGKVTRFSWALDNQARTLHTQIDLPNEGGRLRPGMYATVRLTVDHPGAWTVPSSAVFVQDDQPYVVRVEKGKAARTPVKTGLQVGGRVQLLKKRMQAPRRGEPLVWEEVTGREEVVASNPAALADGQPVPGRVAADAGGGLAVVVPRR
jgi:multidrug efflux pump subunit AcrA (membrane-fusion protein)